MSLRDRSDCPGGSLSHSTLALIPPTKLNMTPRAEVPSSIEMRWPALVALDETPGPDAVRDVLDRVSARLGLSDEQRSIVSPDGSTPLVLSRLVETLGTCGSAAPWRGRIQARCPSRTKVGA